MFDVVILSFARMLSLLLHPGILFLAVPYMVISHTNDNMQETIDWTFFSWIFIFTLVLIVWYQVRKGNFTNFDVSKREQRPKLFLYLGVLSFIYIVALFFLHGPLSMIIVTVGCLVGLLALDVINNTIKASIHVASVSGILLSFVLLNGIQFGFILLLVPFVAWSRIRLHRHTIAETVTGAFFGFFLTLTMYGIIEYVLRI